MLVTRNQVQVLNRYDSCCFPGVRLDIYRDEVSKVAASMGGSFDGMVDDSLREHVVSRAAIDRIVAELAR